MTTARVLPVMVAALLLLIAASCASVPPVLHVHDGETREVLSINGFPMVVLRHAGAAANSADRPAMVFIEGDGLPWATPNIPSLDPTPRRPVALDLFRATDGAAVYLGRPCYWSGISKPPCGPHYWTNGRFAPELVESMAVALEVVRQQLGAQKIILVGYSGGGVLATLLSHRLPDLTGVVAIAAPLAHHLWTERLELAPLAGSLNPEQEGGALRSPFPVVLVYGTRDATVQTSDAGTYAWRPNVQSIMVADADHNCCWLKWWQGDGLALARSWARGQDRPW